MNYEPTITKLKLLTMQVCVPADWTFEQAEEFANRENPAGATHGWQARRDGNKYLDGDPAKNPCAEREGFVHISFDC